MKNRRIALSFIAIVTAVAIVFPACRRINESTELGGGLIPPVDNITTFDTIITVQAFNDTFGIVTDSTRVTASDEQFLGKINSDPFFGDTDARMFFQLKPTTFPYSFQNKAHPDSLFIDSVVLVLDYVETYGDTNVSQTINVYELNQGGNFDNDSAYLIRKSDLTYSNLLGSKTFAPRILNDSIKTFDDTTVSQLRIRLNDAFGTRLLMYDSTPSNGAYRSDSLFTANFKGFALQSIGSGEAVIGLDLMGIDTKLAIYYRHRQAGPVPLDTTVAYFRYITNSGTLNSASANHVTRDYIGSPVQFSLGGALPDPEVFIQNTPGTFAKLQIPDLLNISNRTIHRAELIVEQKYHILDTVYKAPDFLYLDAFDPTITTNAYKFRTIPYDLVLNPTTGELNLREFGVVPETKTDGFGNKIRVWKFNISRYVQHVLTRTQTLYDLRLFAPYYILEQYGIPPATDAFIPIFVNPTAVKGRVRLHGNNGQLDNNPQRIRLRLIYSKL